MTKLTCDVARDPEHRDILVVVLFSVLTLGIGYPIYLVYAWARELNGLANQVRHNPTVVLVLSIVTLGLGAVVYECLYAQEIERHFKERGRTDAMPNLGLWVVTLNVVAFATALTGFGIVVGIPCGMAATCLIQHEMNKLALSDTAVAAT